MFIDECTIEVAAGRGGNGCVSFRREKYVPRGGPDGGDGGGGGDVILCVNPHLRTLSHLRHTPTFRAGSGMPGKGKQMSGARGDDVRVEVPPGTVVSDAGTGELIADMLEPGTEVTLAAGGRRGRGNVHFKRADRRTPRIATKGTDGQRRRLQLTLRLLADVGLIGVPNAGKSTLLSRLSNARPKIAEYPFTTLAPALGIVPVGEYSSMLMADLPGLIEGASEGKGLGRRFLRHIERTRFLLLLIESIDPQPESTHAILRSELEGWSRELGSRGYMVCYTKADLLTDRQRGRLPPLGPLATLLISAHSGEGLQELLQVLEARVLTAARREREASAEGEPEQMAEGHLEGMLAGERAHGTGEHPWPTRWVIPERPGAQVPSRSDHKSDHKEEQ